MVACGGGRACAAWIDAVCGGKRCGNGDVLWWWPCEGEDVVMKVGSCVMLGC